LGGDRRRAFLAFGFRVLDFRVLEKKKALTVEGAEKGRGERREKLWTTEDTEDAEDAEKSFGPRRTQRTPRRDVFHVRLVGLSRVEILKTNTWRSE
jgi:hypothetical protein